jgi:hypothetical protein
MLEIAEESDLPTINAVHANLTAVVEGKWPRLRINNGRLQITAVAGNGGK